MNKMYLNELDNFHFDVPNLETTPQALQQGSQAPLAAPDLSGWGSAPQIGSLSAADEELFRGVIAKYFSDEVTSSPSSEGADDVPAEKKPCLLKDNGFGIGIPETDIVRNLHYDEADTVNTDEIRKQFPILHQGVQPCSLHFQSRRLLNR